MLIAFTGRKRSGKDSAADSLVKMPAANNEEKTFCKIAFATPLKTIGTILGLTNKQMNGTVVDKETIDPKWNKSPRQILQLLGTNLLRNQFDEDIWTKLLETRYNECKGCQHVVVSDVRFNNEAEFIKRLGGIIVNIVRPSLGGPTDTHESEAGIDVDLCDYEIVTDDLKFLLDETAKLPVLYKDIQNSTTLICKTDQ